MTKAISATRPKFAWSALLGAALTTLWTSPLFAASKEHGPDVAHRPVIDRDSFSIITGASTFVLIALLLIIVVVGVVIAIRHGEYTEGEEDPTLQ